MKHLFCGCMSYTLEVVIFALCSVLTVHAHTWTGLAGNGNWNDAANWEPSTSFPNGVEDVANITNDFSDTETIYLNQAFITIGRLNIGDSNNSASVIITNNSTEGVLVFDNGGSPAVLTQISSSRGDGIYVPIEVSGSSLVVSNNTSNYRDLTIGSSISGSGDINFFGYKTKFYAEEDITISNNIGGDGLFYKDGPGNMTLTGDSSIKFGVTSSDYRGLDEGTLTVAGGIVSNSLSGNLVRIFNSADTKLVITNGGFWYQRPPAIDRQGQIVVSGEGSTFVCKRMNSTFSLGAGSSVLVEDGGELFVDPGVGDGNGNRINGASDGCSVTIRNGGRMQSDNLHEWKGDNYKIWIGGTNGAGQRAVWDLSGGRLRLGHGTGSTNGLMVVSSGGLVSNICFSIPNGGTDHALVITNGGEVVLSSNSQIGLAGVNGYAWIGGVDPESGMESILNLNNKRFVLGGYVTSIGHHITVDSGGVVSNGIVYVGGYERGGVDNVMIVTNGGQIYASGYIGFNAKNETSAGSTNNTLIISGEGSMWHVDSSINVGYVSAKAVIGNEMHVKRGGVVSNIPAFYVGFATGGGYAFQNRLVADSGAKLYSVNGAKRIGYAWNNGVTVSNEFYLTDSGTVWDCAGQNIEIGRVQESIGNPGYATGNVLRVESYAIVSNVNDMVIGAVYNDVGSSSAENGLILDDDGIVIIDGLLEVGFSQKGDLSTNNFVRLSGGSLSCSSLKVNEGNYLSPIIDVDGVVPMTVSGTATFEEGTTINPVIEKGAPSGTYTIVEADEIIHNGLSLSPDVNSQEWTLLIDDHSVSVEYSPAGTVIILL